MKGQGIHTTQKRLSALSDDCIRLSASSMDIRAHGLFIPNYGDRYRHGEAISTGFVESTVNQVISKRFVKKQQMRWSPKGAHLLLHVRTKALDKELREKFNHWYSGFEKNPEAAKMAA
jgi:hypothetical protein